MTTEQQVEPRRPTLHRTVLGTDGSWIVFLHGLFGQGKNWTSIAKSLATEHRVLLLDLPDHGRSDWTELIDYAAMGDAVAATLADVAPGERWSVVGHSMGGKVAMLLALQHRELVDRLCVVDMAPIRYRGISSFGDYVRAMRSVDLGSLTGRRQADEALQALVPDPVIRGFLLQNLRRDADPTVPGGVRWRWQMNLRLLGDSLATLWEWPDPRAEPFGGPVLWVGGANSDYITAESAPAMRALFPQLRSVTVKNAGHWVHAEQPQIFTEIVRQFVDASSRTEANR